MVGITYSMTVNAISFKPQKVCTTKVTPCTGRFLSHSFKGLPCGRDKTLLSKFLKIVYNSLILYPMCKKIGQQTCFITFVQPSNFSENRLKHAPVIAIFLINRKEEEKYEETMTNIEDAYLSDGLADSAQS